MPERKDGPPKKLFGLKKRQPANPGKVDDLSSSPGLSNDELMKAIESAPPSQPIDWSDTKGRFAQAEEIIKGNAGKFKDFVQKVQQAAEDEHKHTS